MSKATIAESRVNEITWIRINKKNKLNWLPYLIQAEKIYPLALQSKKEDLIEFFKDENISLICLNNKTYCGNCIACPPEKHDKREYLTLLQKCENKELEEEFTNNKKPRILYIYSITILPEFQGKGIGKKILEKCIELARKEGYTHIIGHYRKNTAWNFAVKCEAKSLKHYINWEKSKEEFVLGVITIKN